METIYRLFRRQNMWNRDDDGHTLAYSADIERLRKYANDEHSKWVKTQQRTGVSALNGISTAIDWQNASAGSEKVLFGMDGTWSERWPRGYIIERIHLLEEGQS